MGVSIEAGATSHGSAEVAQALSAQFTMLSSIFDSLSVAVYVADFATHEMLFVNAFTESVFGKNWRGRRCYEYVQTGQTSPCAFCTNHLLVRDGQAQPPHIWEFQNTIDHHWYLCIDRAIPWVDGHLVRMESAVDITDRKAAERFREQYVGLVSHDLKNPLNAIVLSAKLLERSLKAKKLEAELEDVTRVQRAAKRIDVMIRDLLESVRLESAGKEKSHDRVDLAALVTTILDAMVESERGRVKFHAAEPRSVVLGDRAQLEPVLDNLITNALKHSPPDARVDVEIVRAGDRVTVSVIDRGAGIAAEHQPHIFDRFYRVPGTSVEGLGLGLYITRLIVERHGGLVGVESTPGQGSRFYVTLPIAPT